MWFLILTAIYESNPKATIWNRSEKFMSLKKASASETYGSIRRYFAKQQEIDLFSLIAESRIMQHCFRQQACMLYSYSL